MRLVSWPSMPRLRVDALAWREVDGEVIALDQRASMYLGANETAAVLWKLLADGATHEQLVGALMQAFEVDAATAAEDVTTLLASLAERDLLDPGR